MGLRANPGTTNHSNTSHSNGNSKKNTDSTGHTMNKTEKLLNGNFKSNNNKNNSIAVMDDIKQTFKTYLGGGGGVGVVGGKCTATASSCKLSDNDAKCITTTTMTTRKTTTATSATIRSSSTSALVAAANAVAANLVAGSGCSMRPQTLNVHNLRETPTDQTQFFVGEVLNAWRARARCNVVPAESTQELFHELSFNLSDKQIGEMLQTVKLLARKGSRQSNGLTFGEFSVLAADLKRFRKSTFTPSLCDKVDILKSLQDESRKVASTSKDAQEEEEDDDDEDVRNVCLRSTKSLSNVGDCQRTAGKPDQSNPVEVFLGGSCNPTTWRADVAIPTLKDLGISFYNPQVSDWTPDLIELEHRAKEKARVLFFVMDSETRASAGAIEAAHIAGQNCKQLVLVLHPYKENQSILNEHISQQEYMDLTRNQLILKELVTRRGLPVLDNIPSGLQRTKEILAGIRDPPSNIATVLVVVRGAFDRVNPVDELISLQQCQRALLYLGYSQSLLNSDNLRKIIASQREALKTLDSTSGSSEEPEVNASSSSKPADIDFNLFCVITAYLSVLQQEIHESGCISPIKGTNVPPPPVYLTNMQVGDESFAISYYRNISRNSSNNSVPDEGLTRNSLNELLARNRDSGTSSPQPQLAYEHQPQRSSSSIIPASTQLRSPPVNKSKTQPILFNIESIETTEITTQTIHTNAGGPVPSPLAKTSRPQSTMSMLSTESTNSATTTEEESDSNDSVFSSSSSINSVNLNETGPQQLMLSSSTSSFNGAEVRDVYLGGSCFLRTKWRQDVAMPYLKSKGISFHLPALHESLQPSQLDLPHKVLEDAAAVAAAHGVAASVTPKGHSLIRTRRKCRNSRNHIEEEEEEEEVTVSEETFSWSLPPVRTNLYNPNLLDSSRVLLFAITNETRSLAPMTLAAHCIGLMYNVVLSVQMLPDGCVIGNEKLTPAAIKDYNRGRSYLIDLAKRQGVPVFNDLKPALDCVVDKIKACNSRHPR